MWKKGTTLVIEVCKIMHWIGTFLLSIPIWATIIFISQIISEGTLSWKSQLISIGVSIVIAIGLRRKSLFGKEIPILISKEGIQLDDQTLLIWELIDYVYIKEEPTNNLKDIDHDYLIIEHHNEKGFEKTTVVAIEMYYYNEMDIKRAVNYWSGRSIGSNPHR